MIFLVPASTGKAAPFPACGAADHLNDNGPGALPTASPGPIDQTRRSYRMTRTSNEDHTVPVILTAVVTFPWFPDEQTRDEAEADAIKAVEGMGFINSRGKHEGVVIEDREWKLDVHPMDAFTEGQWERDWSYHPRPEVGQ